MYVPYIPGKTPINYHINFDQNQHIFPYFLLIKFGNSLKSYTLFCIVKRVIDIDFMVIPALCNVQGFCPWQQCEM